MRKEGFPLYPNRQGGGMTSSEVSHDLSGGHQLPDPSCWVILVFPDPVFSEKLEQLEQVSSLWLFLLGVPSLPGVFPETEVFTVFAGYVFGVQENTSKNKVSKEADRVFDSQGEGWNS